MQAPGATRMAENFWSCCLLSDKLLLLSFLLSLSLQKIFQQSFSSSGNWACNFPHLHCCHCHCHCHHRQTRLQGRLSVSLATPPLLTLGALVTCQTSPPRRRERRGWALQGVGHLPGGHLPPHISDICHPQIRTFVTPKNRTFARRTIAIPNFFSFSDTLFLVYFTYRSARLIRKLGFDLLLLSFVPRKGEKKAWRPPWPPLQPSVTWCAPWPSC